MTIIWSTIASVPILGFGIGWLLCAWRDRKSATPKAGTLMRGTGRWVNGGTLYLNYLGGSLVVRVLDRDKIARDQPYLIVDDVWWVEVVTHTPPRDAYQEPHQEGERFPLPDERLLKCFTPLTTQETLALMQQLHESRQEVS